MRNVVQLLLASPAKNVYACSAKMTRDLFRVMSLAPRRKCPRNVVQMKEAMAAFFGSDSVAIFCHCKAIKNYFGQSLDEGVFSREYSVLKLAKNRIGKI